MYDACAIGRRCGRGARGRLSQREGRVRVKEARRHRRDGRPSAKGGEFAGMHACDRLSADERTGCEAVGLYRLALPMHTNIPSLTTPHYCAATTPCSDECDCKLPRRQLASYLHCSILPSRDSEYRLLSTHQCIIRRLATPTSLVCRSSLRCCVPDKRSLLMG